MATLQNSFSLLALPWGNPAITHWECCEAVSHDRDGVVDDDDDDASSDPAATRNPLHFVAAIEDWSVVPSLEMDSNTTSPTRDELLDGDVGPDDGSNNVVGVVEVLALEEEGVFVTTSSASVSGVEESQRRVRGHQSHAPCPSPNTVP